MPAARAAVALCRARNRSRLSGDASQPVSASTFSNSTRASIADGNEWRVSSCSARRSQARSAGGSGPVSPFGEVAVADGDHICDPCRILVASQGASQNQRERDDADLRDVRQVVEAREAGDARQRDAQFRPVAFAGKQQLFQRRSQHVLDDHEAAVRRHHQTFAAQSAVRSVARSFVKDGNRRNKLADQT